MKLDPLELERIREFVVIYKTLPPEQKEVARGKACALSTWRGTDAHTRAVNAYLLKEMYTADAVANSPAPPAHKDVPVPTTAEVLRGLKPLGILLGATVGICAAGFLFVSSVVAIGRAIEAFFVANGSLIVGGALGLGALAFLVSGLRGEKSEVSDVDVKEEKRSVNIIINVEGSQNVTVG